jgi:hypothetical protein
MIENDISEPVSTVEVLKHHPHDAMRQTVGSSMVAIGLRGISKTLSSTESGVMPSIRIGERSSQVNRCEIRSAKAVASGLNLGRRASLKGRESL